MDKNYYYLNSCAPIFDKDYSGTKVDGIRKGIVAEVFLVYFIYVAIIFYGTLNNQYPGL